MYNNLCCLLIKPLNEKHGHTYNFVFLWSLCNLKKEIFWVNFEFSEFSRNLKVVSVLVYKNLANFQNFHQKQQDFSGFMFFMFFVLFFTSLFTFLTCFLHQISWIKLYTNSFIPSNRISYTHSNHFKERS